MSDQEPPIPPIEALRKVRILLFVASESDDMDRVQLHIEMAQAIINEALPLRKPPSSEV